MENITAQHEIFAVGLFLFIVFISCLYIGLSFSMENDEHLKFTVTQEPAGTNFNETLDTIQRLKELDQQGLLKHAEPPKAKVSRERRFRDTFEGRKEDGFYDVSDNSYFDDSPNHSNHDCNSSNNDSSSHDYGSSDCGGGWD